VAAADARKTSAWRAVRTRVLAAEPTADSLDATLSAGTAVGSAVLPAGATGVPVTPAATRVLLEDHVSGGRAGLAHTRFCCRHRHYSHRRGNRTTNNKRFQHT
jgi:hypothetical protein